MARRRARGQLEPGAAVPTWPRISATLGPDGRGEVSWNSVPETISADDLEAARAAIVARCTRLAQQVARAVRLELHEDGRTQRLAVSPTGTVQTIDADGVPELDAAEGRGRAPVVGTCRHCSGPAGAADAHCHGCGAAEPLSRGTQKPSGRGTDGRSRIRRHPARAGGEDEIPAVRPRTGRRALRRDAEPGVPAREPEPERARRSHRHAAGRPQATRALVIEFEEEPPAVLAGSAALGRYPSPVDGRIPVRVDGHVDTVSRTHALVDLDRAGRILVTDYHSTHGTHLNGARTSTFSPGVVYRVPNGAELRLGDLVCRVSTTTQA